MTKGMKIRKPMRNASLKLARDEGRYCSTVSAHGIRQDVRNRGRRRCARTAAVMSLFAGLIEHELSSGGTMAFSSAATESIVPAM